MSTIESDTRCPSYWIALPHCRTTQDSKYSLIGGQYISQCVCVVEKDVLVHPEMCFIVSCDTVCLWLCAFVHTNIEMKVNRQLGGLVLFFCIILQSFCLIKEIPQSHIAMIMLLFSVFVKRPGLEMPDLTLCPFQLVQSPKPQAWQEKAPVSLCLLFESAKALMYFFYFLDWGVSLITTTVSLWGFN